MEAFDAAGEASHTTLSGMACIHPLACRDNRNVPAMASAASEAAFEVAFAAAFGAAFGEAAFLVVLDADVETVGGCPSHLTWKEVHQAHWDR